MTLPSKHEILRRAKKIAMQRQIRHGLPTITPTEFELKESGVFEEARLDLMGSGMDEPIGKTAAQSEQLRYLDVMAQEMKLRVIPKRALRELKKKTGYEWTNGWTEHKRKVKPKAKPTIPMVDPRKPLDFGSVIRGAPKPKKSKKKKKRHVDRVGKTMRVLRKVKGVKMFSFPDDVWKVRKPRKKRRK